MSSSGAGALVEEGGDGGLGATRAQGRHVDVVEDDDEGAAAGAAGPVFVATGHGAGSTPLAEPAAASRPDDVEARDLLLAAVLQDREILLAESGHGGASRRATTTSTVT